MQTAWLVALGLWAGLGLGGAEAAKKASSLSHYRKLPRLTPSILLEELSKRGLADHEEDRFARDDRDYKPLMFGKRGDDQADKRNPDYQPSMFG